jgi:hypothetical protein
MRGEPQRHSHPQRLPRRATDRIEDVVAWLLTTLGLLVAVLAVTTGARLYGEAAHRIDLETQERTQVQAVLLEPAPTGAVLGDKEREARPMPVFVPARYTAPDGTERVTDARVQEPLPAGAVVPIWVDRSGKLTAAPGRATNAVATAATGAAGVLIVGGFVLGGLWAGVRGAILRVNLARWEREWAQVEPRWRGGTRA